MSTSNCSATSLSDSGRGSGGFGVRKRQLTRDRIAAALVAEDGLTATTVDRIAAEAQVGRATFFRYLASKKDAAADGMTRRWLDVITDRLAAQPADLAAPDAVMAAFRALGDWLKRGDSLPQRIQHAMATISLDP